MKRILKLVLVLAVGFGVGWCVAPSEPPKEETPGEEVAAPEAPTAWTCPMHPNIVQPRPGKCPICGMDLVPMGRDEDAGPRSLAMSEAARRLAEIETAPVERRFVTREIRLVGAVDYDETRVKTISAWVPGRLERLFVDYTGVSVREGDHLVVLYSPRLYTAQEELLAAVRRLEQGGREPSEFLRESDRRAYHSAREKLAQLGLTEAQIDAVEERGTARDRIQINSPISGVVIHKALDQGDYVETGTRIYRVADLDQLWVRLDAYEQDLQWLHYGQEVAVHAEAFPGEVFHGVISFLDPVLDRKTRTVTVRVNVDNPGHRLKPGMFVHAVVKSRIASGGRVMDPRLAGKWICPMHPEIVGDGSGPCDICGMDLVPAEELGYVADTPGAAPLVVPATAPLVTGKRAVVYVEVPDTEKPTYQGREVVLGPRSRDHYIVRAGLREGERVVVHGAFKIDSALQIQAKPSMMSMPGEAGFSRRATAVFRASLSPVYQAALDLQTALAADDAGAARSAFPSLGDALDGVRTAELTGKPMALWEEQRAALEGAVEAAGEADGLDGLRKAFDTVSRAVLVLEEQVGHDGTAVYREMHCPMAFGNRGASWLQVGEEVANPWFGASMLRCGEQEALHPAVEEIPGEQPAPPPQKEPGGEPGDDKGGEDAGPGNAVFGAYLDGQEALAADDAGRARAAFERLAAATGDPGEEHVQAVHTAATAAAAAADLAALRKAFEALSEAVLALAGAHGTAGDELHQAYCPMAFDNAGARWLQRGERIANPYFGASMLRCGTVQRTFPKKER